MLTITTKEQFIEATKDWSGLIACDTETYGKIWSSEQRLLGISLAPESRGASPKAVYIALNWFVNSSWVANDSESLVHELRSFFLHNKLIGYNFTYDKRWLLESGYSTSWAADCRIMWHMASAPAGPRSYGLKDAQKELLGWEEANDKELELQVKSRGGRLKDGQHYLADLDILSKYACLDAISTIEVYKKLSVFFDTHSYWPLLRDIMDYNELLEVNTTLGVKVDSEGLRRAHKRLLQVRGAALKRFLKQVKPQIEELGEDWKDRKIALYKREYNKIHYLNNPDKWERFNLNSDAHKRELFYGKLGFSVIEKTEGGKPSTAADSLKLSNHPCMEAYLKYEKANTLSTNFSGPYLDSVVNSRLHPGFNICGTVSYRLSGFKPYLLNAPFDEKAILRNIKCDEGWIGVHADLAAIEPTITAHYSEDPHLLKVFRDGLGDIYLDLALRLFPNDKELHDGYRPDLPIDKKTKERFAKQRKVSKVIQLAVQYTGTGHTVAKNLTKEGISTSLWQANSYVAAYWSTFHKVAEFNARLREINRKRGYLRNVIGRVIRVPDPEYKDLGNRFIQSSAHDVLILWVLEIYRLCAEKQIEIKPVLLDCHDSTSNQVREGTEHLVKQIYQTALDNVVDKLELSVKVKMEAKTFRTLAGLKNDE